ncbi:MAG: CRTAC1 family protein [Truepera sp.]|nr:CRTAC1 family protein [Truepera sp.]
MTYLVYLSTALMLGWALGQTGPQVPVALAVEPLATPKACVDSFRTRTLNHVTSVPGGDRVRSFEANGGGVALGDLDTDGDLDLVGGTYDAALLNALGPEILGSGNSGVYIYENRRGGFRATRLAGSAQALALTVTDLDEDGHPDIVVGNDFAVPDMIWYRRGRGWAPAAHFGSPKNTSLYALEIRWPDDTLSRIEDPRADTRITIRREGR